MNIIGELLMAEVIDNVPGETTIYTPWFRRQGNNLNSTFEVISIGGAEAQVTVSLYHKNSDDTGGGTVNTPSGSYFATSAGVNTFRNTGCKELVRYGVKLSTSTAEPTGTYALHAIVRMLGPAWEWTGA